MTARTWVILGATSNISEQFAQYAAKTGCTLRLVGRQKEQLTIIAHDIQLRYRMPCDVLVLDITQDTRALLKIFENITEEVDLFIAQSDFTDNADLTPDTIHQLITVNIEATVLVIDNYLRRKQTQHNLLYLSSVAACRGRAKNSLYGASKACIEVYLEGLQQRASKHQCISVARLGFIDTRQTYGMPGIFYAASAQACAKACWHAVKKKKRVFYFPFFWRGIMAIISRLPFFIYNRMNF